MWILKVHNVLDPLPGLRIGVVGIPLYFENSFSFLVDFLEFKCTSEPRIGARDVSVVALPFGCRVSNYDRN